MKKLLLIIITLISLNAVCQNDPMRTDWANIKKYSADNEHMKTFPVNAKRVVFMGNSITEGWKNSDSSFFSNNHYIDRGISGQTTPQMLVRFRNDVIDLKPAVVVILAGINDIAENTGPIALEDIFGNIVSMAQLARANHIIPILCSVLPANVIPWRQEIKPAEKVVQLNAMIRKYCIEHKLIYVDYYSSMVDETQGLSKKYSDDGVHPTLAGYKVMEPLVNKAIRRLFQK